MESQLTLIDLRGAVESALNELRALEIMDAEIRALAAQRDAATQRVEQMNQLREAMSNVKDARDALERAEEITRELEHARAEFSEANRATIDAPNLKARANNLRHLLHHVTRLDQIRAAENTHAQRAQLVAQNATRLNDLSASVARDEKELAQLENQLREYEIGKALGEWIAAQRAPADETGEDAIAEKKIAREKIARQLRLQVYGLAALLVVFILAAIGISALIFAPLALATLGLLAFRASTLWRDLARASEAVGRAEGHALARGESNESQRARLQAARARLAQLGAGIPETSEVAQARRVLIAREMKNKTSAELRGEHDALRERLVNARAVLGELARQSQIADPANVEREKNINARKAAKAKEIRARWEPRVEKIARTLDVHADVATIQRAVFQNEAQAEQINRRARDAARLQEEISRREEQLASQSARARQMYENARAVKADALAWNPALTLDDYTAFGKALRAEYDSLGGEAALQAAREIENELGRKEGERATRERNTDELIAQIQERVQATGRPLSATIAADELNSLAEKLRAMALGDEAELRGQHRELVGRVRSLEDQHANLERELGLSGEALNRDECRATYAQTARQLQVRERGAEMTQLARRRIMQKVLPATMDYLRRILPQITRDRYYDARLDDETYKIQVWDERGGGFKEKNIFSGGTRDQFSLALRLAFALATLPQERGAAPSFIFLDEPLGSFDSERAEALIYLLTEGEIARAFDQIFLISHVHVDERLFTHRVLMENGKIAFSDLPNEEILLPQRRKEPKEKK
ncbi:MAG: hypothetical protein HY070_02585 [Chloroflexi bacterium]|nr:hypothetical protein [Chloroflexota bacterium]